jgi:hypothetical protein
MSAVIAALARKSRRLARNSQLGGAAAIISFGNPEELFVVI